MTSHRIGTREEWLTASAGLLEREKELRDQPAAREDLRLVTSQNADSTGTKAISP